MIRKLLPVLLFAFTPAVFAQSLPGMDDIDTSEALGSLEDLAGDSLSGALQGQLGLSEDQADGSIGSLLGLAAGKLDSGDFDRFAGMIPGADKYMDKAKSLGAIAGPLQSLGELNQSLGALGISPETVEKFIPMVTDYLGKLGGDDAMALLQQVLG